MPDVTVCGVESLFVHVTVSPTFTVILDGEKVLSVLVAEPAVMETAVVSPADCADVVVLPLAV